MMRCRYCGGGDFMEDAGGQTICSYCKRVHDEPEAATVPMSVNETAIRAFAAQFSPPLAVGRTERINEVPIEDAWVCSHWDQTRGLGISAFAFRGQFKAYIEAAGSAEIAERAGYVIGKAMGLIK